MLHLLVDMFHLVDFETWILVFGIIVRVNVSVNAYVCCTRNDFVFQPFNKDCKRYETTVFGNLGSFSSRLREEREGFTYYFD